MKRLLLLLAFCACFASCSSVSPVGAWNYSITGTPNGDYAGVMTVTKTNKVYAAILSTSAGDLPFSKFGYDPKTKKSTGGFDYQGIPISFDATLNGEEMKGNVSTDDAQFPFAATRKK